MRFQPLERRRRRPAFVDDERFEVRPGRPRDGGAPSYRKARSLVGRVLQASRRAGYTPLGRSRARRGTGRLGRGKRASLAPRRSPFQRRVVIKARVVRHRGARYRSAPLARHLAYLEREGVTRGGSDATMFDAGSDEADGDAFAARCEDDRHHFRFIVSPEDAADMANLRGFTRELMQDMARDLDTRLDWVAADHWNTDNPHIHVLVRGVAGDRRDLVIDRAYISHGMRARAEERVTIELGPRSERDIRRALLREVEAERWTGLDARLDRLRDDCGVVDLRPETGGQRRDRTFLIGRARVLERMGLAERAGPASWRLAAGREATLRALGERGDIIKTMHRAMAGQGIDAEAAPFALHTEAGLERVIGRLVERGLHDELTGEAYAVVEGLDGRMHHLRFADIERTGDAAPGAIVETGNWTDRKGRRQASLLVRSDWSVEKQIAARGATWLDRQLVSPRPELLAGRFGSQVREALAERTAVLCQEGLAQRQGQRATFAADLLGTLRERDLAAAGEALTARCGGAILPAAPGDHVAGVYRERVTLASGRFAMIDNGGLGFHLVPWRRDLERHLGQPVAGRNDARGTVDWSFARPRGRSI